MYKYFISYQYTKNNSFGFGNTEMDFETPIKSIYDISDIQARIKDLTEYNCIIILNYILL